MIEFCVHALLIIDYTVQDYILYILYTIFTKIVQRKISLVYFAN